MKNKKNGLKICLLIFLCLVVLLEVGFLFINNSNNDKDASNNTVIDNLEEDNNSQYIANYMTPYLRNGLTFNEVSEKYGFTYYTISGLKNSKIEKEINDKIIKKYNDLKSKVSEDKIYSIRGLISASFENVLSVRFILNYKYDNYVSANYYDALNVNLNTGEELKIEDVIYNKDVLKTIMLDSAYHQIYKGIGLICQGGPCENKNPNYGVIEDVLLNLAMKFNKGDYVFYFTPERIVLNFIDIEYPDPEEIDTVFDDVENNPYTCHIADPDSYEISYCDYIQRDISVSAYFYEQTDNVIIYDKFKSEENIFNNERKEISRKFIENEYFGNDDYGFGSYFIENDNMLIDMVIDTRLPDNHSIVDNAKKDFLEESKVLLKNDKFNYMYVSGEAILFNDDYYYVYYNIYHYALTKDEFEKIKPQIYLDKINGNRYEYVDWFMEFPKGYEPLKDKLTEKAYYFYIYDKSGNPVSCKEITNTEELINIIPDSWLSLGKYKTKEDLINSMYYIADDEVEFTDRLVMYVLYDCAYFQLSYKGEKLEVGDYLLPEKIFK